jgi:hypothetical protein
MESRATVLSRQASNLTTKDTKDTKVLLKIQSLPDICLVHFVFKFLCALAPLRETHVLLKFIC